MQQALIVDFHIKPEHVRDFATAIQTNAMSALANEPGCLYFDVCRDPSDTALFFLYELYADEQAIEAHRKSSHFLAFSEQTQDWVLSKTVRRMQRADTSGTAGTKA